MAVQTMRIEILGTSFTIQTDESREYIESILAYLRKRTEEVRASTRVEDALKTSILASVYIVDELFRARSGFPSTGAEAEELGRLANRMIDRLDRGLSGLADADGVPSGGKGTPSL